MRIEEVAAKKQARLDSEQDILVGVNHYQSKEEEELALLEVDNRSVLNQQIKRLDEIKEKRDDHAVQATLAKLTLAAKAKVNGTAGENLLHCCVAAARARATLGEISDAMEVAFGRFQPKNNTFTGVYAKAVNNDKAFEKAKAMSDEFAQKAGRRPRIMIAKMGQDGHDRGAKVVATSYADIGFDVDLGPLFQTPEEAAKQAVENDVHVLGISSLAAGHKTLVPAVIKALEAYDRADIKVIVGGVIPPNDYDFLYAAGVVGVYGPGTKISTAAQEILSKLLSEF